MAQWEQLQEAWSAPDGPRAGTTWPGGFTASWPFGPLKNDLGLKPLLEQLLIIENNDLLIMQSTTVMPSEHLGAKSSCINWTLIQKF